MTEVSGLVGVRNVPGAVRSLFTIREPDYVDLFTVATSVSGDRPAERWARAVLEEAPLARRNARFLWRLIGLRLGEPGSPDHVQGWRIAARGDSWMRLETTSWYITAEALSIVDDGRASLSLCLRYDNPVAAAVWALVSRPHQRAVPVMVHQAAQLMDVEASGT